MAHSASQSYRRHHAAALQRQNLNLHLAEVAREVRAEADRLSERARDLAESEIIVQLAQDGSNASPDHSALAAFSAGRG